MGSDDLLFGTFPVGDVPDSFDGTGDISLRIIQRTCLSPEEHPARSEIRNKDIDNKGVADPLYSIIPFLDLDFRA